MSAARATLGRSAAALAAGALLALLLFAPPAAVAGVRPPEGMFGSAAQPSFSEPEGIAVDQSTATCW